MSQNEFYNLEISTIEIRFWVWDAIKGLWSSLRAHKRLSDQGTSTSFHHITTKTNNKLNINILQILGFQAR